MQESPYRRLIVWQRAMDLAVHVTEVSASFPSIERFGLTMQIRKAAGSVPSNIAEGRGRGSVKDYRHFLHQARGSLYEVETQTILAKRVGYIDEMTETRLLDLATSVARPLNGLIAALNRSADRTPQPAT